MRARLKGAIAHKPLDAATHVKLNCVSPLADLLGFPWQSECSRSMYAVMGSPHAEITSRAAPFESQRGERRKPWSQRKSLTVATSRFVLRALAAAWSFLLASSHSGNDRGRLTTGEHRGPLAHRAFPDESGRARPMPGRTLFHTSEAPGTIIADTGRTLSLSRVQLEGWAASVTVSVALDVGFQWSGIERGVSRTVSGRTGGSSRR